MDTAHSTSLLLERNSDSEEQKVALYLKFTVLLCFAPLLDTNGFLRLRRRLQFSQLQSTEKHPFIPLSRDSQLTTLVVDHHRRTLHGGPELMLSSIRTRFWIIDGCLRCFIHRCMIYFRHRATASQQLIEQLPPSRVTVSSFLSYRDRLR